MYRPHHKVREDYLTTGIHHYFDCAEALPGQTVRGTITFITPEVYPYCLWVGRVVDIQEGSRVIGRARITRIMNKRAGGGGGITRLCYPLDL